MWLICLVLLCGITLILFHILPKKHWLRFYCGYFNFAFLTHTVHSIIALSFLTGIPTKQGFPKIIKPLSLIMSQLLGIKFEVRNEDQAKNVKQAVVVVNHQSMIDILALGCTSSIGQCICVAKSEVKYYLGFGVSCYLSGIIFLDRNAHEVAMKQLIDEATVILPKCEKLKIFVFPEGTRNKSPHKLLNFKKGAFRLAIEKQIPIMPLVLSPYYFIDGKRKIFAGGKIICSFLEPMETSGLQIEDVDMLTSKTMALMQEEYYRLAKEVEILKN